MLLSLLLVHPYLDMDPDLLLNMNLYHECQNFSHEHKHHEHQNLYPEHPSVYPVHEPDPTH